MKIEEALLRFVGQECLIYVCSNAASGSVIECTVTEIGEGWLRAEQEDKTESIVNISNIVRIREYPRNKNEKKKIVFD